MSNKKINRRDFMQVSAAASVATAAALTGCAEGDNNTAGPKPKGEMTYRTNPKTGEKVSILGYGCMRWPTIDGVSAREGNSDIDQEQVNRLVDEAMANGVNYFDTSPAYCKGFSERATGIALSRHPRESYYVATKLSNFSPQQWSREASLQMYHNSFKELQVDYIDYMLLHAVGGGGIPQLNARYYDNGILDFLLEERAAGRIRNLGFSYHGDIEVFDYLLSRHDEYKWDFVQIQMNYLDWRHAKTINPSNTNAEYLYAELRKRNIPAVIMEPLLGGRLSKLPAGIVRRLKERRPEDSVASWAFRFAGTPEGVLTVLSGMTYMEHLKDNLASFSPLDPITADEDEFLQRIADEIITYNTVPCNDCKYCMPCPYGIDIPANLLHYNKCIVESHMALGPQDPNFAEARKIFLVDYDRHVPRERQADHCIQCGKCIPHCPQRIDIPKELSKINVYAEMLKRAGK